MRLKSFDNYLLLLMSATALLCIYVLYGPEYLSSKIGQGATIANIIDQANIVKRKRDFYQSWSDASSGDSLSADDEIYTHANSSATIYFKNGQKIELSENSLIKIKQIENRESLNLLKGNLTAELSPTAKNLNINIKGKEYSFNSESAKIQIEQSDKENKFILLDGSANFKINKTTNELKLNHVLVENRQTGEVKIQKLPFIQKFPINQEKFYFTDNFTINLKWQSVGNSTKANILVSDTKDFTHILKDEILDEDNLNITLSDEGSFYWKIISSEGIVGPTRTFKTIKERPLIISSNQNQFINSKLLQIAHLNWKQDDLQHYLVNVKYPNQESKNYNLTSNFFDLPLKELGYYSIKVKIQSSKRPLAIFSNEENIQLSDLKDVILTTPSPNLIDKIIYNNKVTTQMINWESSFKNINYHVIIKSQKISKDFYTEDSNVLIKLQERGTIQWEVSAELNGKTISNKLAGIINVKTPMSIKTTPAKGSIIELDRPEQLVNFNWDNKDESGVYQFELADNESFINPIVTEELSQNHLSTGLAKTGKYFWRVKLKNKNNIEYSEPTSVEIRPIPPLKKPEISPAIKVKIKYLDSSINLIKKLISFFIDSVYAQTKTKIAEWDLITNSKVKTYIVEIYSAKDLGSIIKRIESKSAHIIWSDAISGDFVWRVAYIDHWGRTSDFSNFSRITTEEDSIKPVLQVVQPIKKETTKKAIIEKPIPLPVVLKEKRRKGIIASYSPSIISYENQLSNKKILINGTILNSIALNYFDQFEKYSFTDYKIFAEFQRGVVFDSLIFNDLHLGFKLQKQYFSQITGGPILLLYKDSSYHVVSSKVAIKNNFGTMLGVLGEFNLNQYALELNFAIGTSTQLKSELKYKINNHYSLGTFYKILIKGNEKNNLMGLNFNYTFDRE